MSEPAKFIGQVKLYGVELESTEYKTEAVLKVEDVSKTEEHPRRTWIKDMIEGQELEQVGLLDGHDDAILGLVDVGDKTVVAYSTKKILARLQEDGMDAEDAQEYFDFNIAGAKFEGSPCFVQDELEPV